MYHSPATLSFLRNMNEEQKPPWENDETVFIAKLCFFTCQLSVIQDRFGKGLISEIISDFVYSNRVTRYLMSAVKRRMFWNKYVNKQGNVHIFESCSRGGKILKSPSHLFFRFTIPTCTSASQKENFHHRQNCRKR